MKRFTYPEKIISTWLDYPDVESQAIEVFMRGCLFNCENCQNKQLQTVIDSNCDYIDIVNAIKKEANIQRTNKIVFVGGEPLLKTNNNLLFMKRFLDEYKDEFDVCIYTGHSKNYCIEQNVKGFKFLKTGLYDHKLAQESIKTEQEMIFASSNQELYNEEYQLLTKEGILKFKEN